jgi:hypothetical protein
MDLERAFAASLWPHLDLFPAPAPAPAPRRPTLRTVECPICYDSVTARAARRLPCAHTFHRKCMKRHLQTAARPCCPMCRAAIA